MLKTSKRVAVGKTRAGLLHTPPGQASDRNGTGQGPTPAAEQPAGSAGVVTRKACAHDVQAIRDIVDPLVVQRRMLPVKPVSFYTSLQRFRVAERAGRIVGCGALHVAWENLAEIRTVAIRPHALGTGVGSTLVKDLLQDARDLGMRRVFCLTFETAFFARHGFTPFQGQAVSPEVYAEILHRYDHDVAQLLDLAWVKPNTLGNTCMVLTLDAPDAGEQSVPASF